MSRKQKYNQNLKSLKKIFYSEDNIFFSNKSQGPWIGDNVKHFIPSILPRKENPNKKTQAFESSDVSHNKNLDLYIY